MPLDFDRFNETFQPQMEATGHARRSAGRSSKPGGHDRTGPAVRDGEKKARSARQETGAGRPKFGRPVAYSLAPLTFGLANGCRSGAKALDWPFYRDFLWLAFSRSIRLELY